jgi:hypothetical protein
LSNPPVRTGGDSGLMTISDGQPHMNGDAEATEDSILSLDDCLVT